MTLKCLVLSGHPRSGNWDGRHKYVTPAKCFLSFQEALILLPVQLDTPHLIYKCLQVRGQAAGWSTKAEPGGAHLEGPCPAQGAFGHNIKQTLHSGSEVSDCLRCQRAAG